MRLTCVVLAALLTAASTAGAQSLEELKQKESLDHTMDLLNQAEAILNSASRQRRVDCAKAIGNVPLCTCLDDKLAVAWSFADYVAILTRTKEENGYDSIDTKLKPAYDNVAAVRDACVASAVAP